MKELSRREAIKSFGAGIATMSAVPTAALTADVVAPTLSQKIDAIVERAMTERRIPGVILTVMRNGEALVRKGYGYSHLELRVSAQPDHLYGSGSTGKMFTALAIMQLVEAGALSLSDPIGRLLPDTPPSWAGITVDHLMRHRSGIKTYDLVSDFHVALEWSDAEFIKAVGGWPLEFTPGTKISYSNTGYVLLGFVISRASGMPIQDYMRQRVFIPAGMRKAQVDDTLAILPHRAQGYAVNEAGEPIRPAPVSRSVNRFGDGSLLFNADDLVAWEKTLRASGLISPQSQALVEAATPLNNGLFPLWNYGAGWSTRMIRGRRLVSHSGTWNGFGAWIGRWPDDGLAISVCTNLERGLPGQWAPKIAALFDPGLAPYEAIADNRPQLTARDRERVVRHLAGGFRTDGSNPQQVANAMEVGPIAPNHQFEVVAIEGSRRVYRLGKGLLLDWIVRLGSRGAIEITVA